MKEYATMLGKQAYLNCEGFHCLVLVEDMSMVYNRVLLNVRDVQSGHTASVYADRVKAVTV